MPRALIELGPADGDTFLVEHAPPILYYAKAATRQSKDWIELERYAWVPPQNKAKRVYRHIGRHSVQGPVEGLKDSPDWSL